MAKDKAAEVLRKELLELETEALRLQARMSAVREALRVLGAGAPNASQGASAEASGASEAGGVHHRTGKKMSDDTKKKMKESAEARWRKEREKKAAQGTSDAGGGAVGEGQAADAVRGPGKAEG